MSTKVFDKRSKQAACEVNQVSIKEGLDLGNCRERAAAAALSGSPPAARPARAVACNRPSNLPTCLAAVWSESSLLRHSRPSPATMSFYGKVEQPYSAKMKGQFLFMVLVLGELIASGVKTEKGFKEVHLNQTRRTRWVMHHLSKVNGGVPVPKDGLPKDGVPVTSDEVPKGGV
ncbi:hypothetical protein TRIUR3_05877 [Triticum urartu]|uniref:Uncharacterized protein n=1 Tax=Triticum urartu TaxID=4572 RepID=M7YXF6_TRIUA|nr:hypothetical protein TRIUR3_05877 [Triticum urartu]